MSNFSLAAFDTAGTPYRARQALVDFARRALPQRCQLCAAASGVDLVCSSCSRDLPRLQVSCPICALPVPHRQSGGCGACLVHPPPFDATVAAFTYAFPIDRLVHAFKYRGRLALAEWFATALLAAVDASGPAAPDVLIALPLSPARQRERGYNQAAEIARCIAAIRGVPLVADGVRRIRSTPPQAALAWSARARNVRGAFRCDVELAGLNIAVVDDVMTTGASLAEFAATLRAAGAMSVQNWIVARTLAD